MVNGKLKKAGKESAGKTVSSSRKTTSKGKNTVKKNGTTVQKKKSPVKKTAASKEKKPVTKKVAKKPVGKGKPKVAVVKKTATTKEKKSVAKKKPVSKNLKKTAIKENADLKIQKASKTQVKKVENVIDKLSQTPEQHFVTIVPGVLRKAPAVKQTVPADHKEAPISGILNYLKKIF